MYKVTRMQKRSNTNVDFYLPHWSISNFDEIEYVNNFLENYEYTAFWIKTDFEYSEDKLTFIMYNFWKSEEAYSKFKLDPLGLEKFNSLLNKYCLENNITHELVNMESIP